MTDLFEDIDLYKKSGEIFERIRLLAKENEKEHFGFLKSYITDDINRIFKCLANYEGFNKVSINRNINIAPEGEKEELIDAIDIPLLELCKKDIELEKKIFFLTPRFYNMIERRHEEIEQIMADLWRRKQELKKSFLRFFRKRLLEKIDRILKLGIEMEKSYLEIRGSGLKKIRKIV